MGASGIAAHYRLSDTPLAITTTVRNQSGEAAASVTLVGPTSDLQPRMAELGRQTPPRVPKGDPRELCDRRGRPGRSRRSGLRQCGSYWTAQAVQRTTGAVRGGFVTIPTISCVHIGKE